LIFNSKGEMLARVEETLSAGKMTQLLTYHNTDANKTIIKHNVNQSPRPNTKSYQSYTPKQQKVKTPIVKSADQKYRIQLGVFKEFENSFDLVTSLKSQFIEPVIVLNDDSEGQQLYKVMMGEFSTKEEADDYKSILEKEFKLLGIVK